MKTSRKRPVIVSNNPVFPLDNYYIVRAGAFRSKNFRRFLIGKIKQIQGRVFERLFAESGINKFNGAQGRYNKVSARMNEIFYKDFHDEETTNRVINTVARSEFKRRQAPPLLKVSPRPFGIERTMPIVRVIHEVL